MRPLQSEAATFAEKYTTVRQTFHITSIPKKQDSTFTGPFESFSTILHHVHLRETKQEQCFPLLLPLRQIQLAASECICHNPPKNYRPSLVVKKKHDELSPRRILPGFTLGSFYEGVDYSGWIATSDPRYQTPYETITINHSLAHENKKTNTSHHYEIRYTRHIDICIRVS